MFVFSAYEFIMLLLTAFGLSIAMKRGRKTRGRKKRRQRTK